MTLGPCFSAPRRDAEHALCNWQRQPVMAGPDWDEPPTDGPGSDDPDTGPSERSPAASPAVLASPASPSAGGDSAASAAACDGPYHAGYDTTGDRAWLWYAHPRYGWVKHGGWGRSVHRSRVARIAATLNAMRWPDAI